MEEYKYHIFRERVNSHRREYYALQNSRLIWTEDVQLAYPFVSRYSTKEICKRLAEQFPVAVEKIPYTRKAQGQPALA